MQTVHTPVSRSVAAVLAVTCALLLIPLVAMQFTAEVNWTLSDFIAAGVLIAGTGLLYVGLTRVLTSPKQRLAVAGVLGVLFLLTWIELAVGIFGTPFAGS